jgi:hypothetical protein
MFPLLMTGRPRKLLILQVQLVGTNRRIIMLDGANQPGSVRPVALNGPAGMRNPVGAFNIARNCALMSDRATEGPPAMAVFVLEPLDVLEPPAHYNHPYGGQVIERVLSLREARRVCARMGLSSDACSWSIKGRCFVVIPRDGPVPDLQAYRRHEVAHCNGWEHGAPAKK